MGPGSWLGSEGLRFEVGVVRALRIMKGFGPWQQYVLPVRILPHPPSDHCSYASTRGSVGWLFLASNSAIAALKCVSPYSHLCVATRREH